MTRLLPILLLGLGCGDESEPNEHGHDFTNYSQCYNHHAGEEGMPAQDAMAECDEVFADDTTFADRAACDTYYAAQESVPAEEATAHCEDLFPA